MGKQTGDIILYGTLVGACGYVMQDGNAVIARKPGPKHGRRVWSRLVDAERVRFGERSEEAGQVWRRLPGRLRLLAGEHGYHEFLRRMLLGNGRMAGFSLSPDVSDDRVSCLVSGQGDLIGADIGTMGKGFPRSVLVVGDQAVSRYQLGEAGFPGRDFLPAGGHHVTGGIGRSRNRARKEVIAKQWNRGEGLRDRREMEAEKWDAVAREKGHAGSAAWFQAMALHLGKGVSVDHEGPDEGRVLMRVVVACVKKVRTEGCKGGLANHGGSWSWHGDWQPATNGLEVALPRWQAGAVFAGVEFGYVRRGVVVPLRCLNRVWCVGVWLDEVIRGIERKRGRNLVARENGGEIGIPERGGAAVICRQASGGP